MSTGLPRRSLVLLTACCGVFVSFASIVVYTFGVFLKPLAAAFGWSRAEVSLGFTLTALTVAACSPFIGRLLDRYPARRIVIPCTAIYGIAFCSLAFLTSHLSHLLVVFFMLGVVGNGTTQLGYARIVSAWFDRERGRALAAVMAGSGLGSMLFPPYRAGAYFRVWMACCICRISEESFSARYSVAAPSSMNPRFHQASRIPSRSPPSIPVWQSILSFRFLGIVGALLLFSFATNGLYAHWAALLTDRGFPAELAATVLSFAGLAALISKLSTGYLLDRFFAARAVAGLLAAPPWVSFALSMVTPHGSPLPPPCWWAWEWARSPMPFRSCSPATSVSPGSVNYMDIPGVSTRSRALLARLSWATCSTGPAPIASSYSPRWR